MGRESTLIVDKKKRISPIKDFEEIVQKFIFDAKAALKERFPT